jgi:hypothetical protein
MLLKTIQDALTRQLYEGVSGTVIPRGLAYPLDPFLFGTVRFGKKAGFEYSLLVPDNRYALTEDAIYLTDRLILDRSPTWISSGDFVSVGLRELHRVEDVSKNTVILATTLLADHALNTFVYHHSAAITVEGSYAIDQTTINIDTPSTWVVVPGDVICISFDTDVDVLAFNEYTVETVSKIGTTSAVTQWLITLDRGIHRALTDGESIQLRAYPAYVSRALKIPQSGEAIVGVVGPYLLDWTSMPFVDKLEVVEYQTVQYLDNTLVPTGSPISATKNSYVLDVPIRSDQFFFWDKVAGELNYDNTMKRVIGQYDPSVDGETEGWWWIKHTAVPVITVPTIPARGYIITPAKALLLNTDSFIVQDDADQIRFEYKIDGAYVPTPEVAAAGAITVAAFPGGHPVDNDTLVLDNGFGTVVTFEFKRTIGFISTSAANKIIDVTASALPTDIAVAIEAAVNSVQAVLGITALNTGPLVAFTNDEISTLGNTNITGVNLGVWAAGGPVVNFAGGTDKVETIDISAAAVTSGIHVANLTAAAINRSGVHVRAEYTSLAPSVALTSTVAGPLGNALIVESVFTPGFVVSGMSGGFGGKTWGCRVRSTVAATLRIRLYPNAWQDTVLAANIDTAVTITLGATDLPVERIDILAVSGIPVPVGAEIQMSDWTPNRSRVKAIQHSYVAHVHGERNYACTGIWAKQVFRSFDDLRLPFDNNGNYDAGFVMV